ncbi:MAG: beta-ketoacyl-ACP synthase II, partial [Deltaproteobacteria bacterium]|nr:beta-ketoacyl-ACP synthase II [Deltaproteobacteria bacterium]
MGKRVVVTGMGIISPLGTGVEKNWEAICQSKSGIAPITRFDTSDFTSKIAGEVKDFNPEDYMDKKEVKKMDIFIQFALASGKMAIQDSQLEIDESNADRVGVLVGAGIGGLSTIEKYHSILLEKGPKKISPFFIPMLIVNLAPGQISIYFGARGPNSSIVTACATGNHSIGEALRIIQRGDADAMIAGGAESTITPLAVGGFSSMKALSTRNDEPEKASRPFEKDRDGFIIAEGAGVLILEELECALKRKAEVYAEIIGFGCNADAYHISAPSPNGIGASRCMEIALKDAGINYDEIDYVNAHATGTLQGDIAEAAAINKTVGNSVPVSSFKGHIGHTLGAAGALETIILVEMMRRQEVVPTLNLDNPDPHCNSMNLPREIEAQRIDTVMKNNFAL